jgi:hypothetical protein
MTCQSVFDLITRTSNFFARLRRGCTWSFNTITDAPTEMALDGWATFRLIQLLILLMSFNRFKILIFS